MTGMCKKRRRGNFLVMYRGQESAELRERHPKAFLLLSLVAERARYDDTRPNPYNLEVGEALIGDFKAAGLKTNSEYRHALSTIKAAGFVTTRATSRGTIAKLVNTGIFDPFRSANNEQSNEQNDDQSNDQSNEQSDDKQEREDFQEKKDTKRGRASDSSRRKPTPDEVADYLESIGMPRSDGEALFDKWEGSGWMNGKNKIKCWMATARSWKRHGYLASQQRAKGTNGSRGAYDASTGNF